ncbi:MAG: hydroxymethylpyrimidine/phosphomethylpyrimidine kinase [Burkholderiaceae bacterium]|nr:hydroxymethylpyrimidine/phosphomethylpyrimidine kinase [Burkholderiaceae bacterium]
MTRRCVLVFAGLDPSGGAGISADIEAIGAIGAHALPIITALTVQDNDRVFAVNPVDAGILRHQAQVLIDKIPVAAVKIGIVGNRANAEAIAEIIDTLRQKQPDLPVVLDTVLASGHGDALSDNDPAQALVPLIGLATLIAPNLPEAARLCPGIEGTDAQAQQLLHLGARHVLIKGGHGAAESDVVNRWYTRDDSHAWTWQRLPGEFHGSGCTLASAVAAFLAKGRSVRAAIGSAQLYAHRALETAYAITDGQRIPQRHVDLPE